MWHTLLSLAIFYVWPFSRKQRSSFTIHEHQIQCLCNQLVIWIGYKSPVDSAAWDDRAHKNRPDPLLVKMLTSSLNVIKGKQQRGPSLLELNLMGLEILWRNLRCSLYPINRSYWKLWHWTDVSHGYRIGVTLWNTRGEWKLQAVGGKKNTHAVLKTDSRKTLLPAHEIQLDERTSLSYFASPNFTLIK